MKIVLASASERRKELLSRLIDNFEIKISDFDEKIVKFEGNCDAYVKKLALCKAASIRDKLNYPAIVIGCDTIVYQNGKVLGKPKDKEEAFSMLMSLSQNKHEVYSGLAVINAYTGEIVQESICTEVYFSKLSEKQVLDYIESGDPMDKAGAYGIQGYGGIFVEKISGCYYNVVGLPINKLYFILKGMGVNL